MSMESIKDTVHAGMVDALFANQDVEKAATHLNYDDFQAMENDKERVLARAREAEEKLGELRTLTERVSELLGWGVGSSRTAEGKTQEASGLLESARGRTQGTQDGLTPVLGAEKAQSYTAESLKKIKAADSAVTARQEAAVRVGDEFAAVQAQSQELNTRLAALGGELAGLIEKIGTIGNNPDGSTNHGAHQATTDTLGEAQLATAASHQGLSELYLEYRNL